MKFQEIDSSNRSVIMKNNNPGEKKYLAHVSLFSTVKAEGRPT
jgi:hypothetical protein